MARGAGTGRGAVIDAQNGTVATGEHEVGDVLCVDDDPVVQIILSEVIVKAGARYRAAHNAREAEAVIGNTEFDLVLLDRRLPDSDGLLLIQTIRERCDCPVIVLSEMSGARDRQLGLGLGATHYVAKPFQPAELASRIRLLLTERLRTRHRSLATPIERGGFSFVPLTRRLSLGDEVIHLPPAEARLFHVLLLHEGEMLTRDHLTLKACGREWSPGDRTVDVLIARLRRRLPLETAEIVTIHRSGYLLSVHDV